MNKTINNQLMSHVFLSILFLISLCGCSIAENKPEREYFLARITFYTDCPVYGKKTASTRIAQEGTTVAAANHIPFGTQYEIPRLKEWMNTDGVFRVDDRGPDVNSRVASRGKLPVIDIYVSSHIKVRELGRKSNNIFKVYRK